MTDSTRELIEEIADSYHEQEDEKSLREWASALRIGG